MAVGGDDFDVTLEELDELVTHMTTVNAHIERTGEEIQHRIESLHQTWTGDAAQAHARWQEDWNESLHEIREGLDRIKTASKTAHENYTSAVQTNQKMWP